MKIPSLILCIPLLASAQESNTDTRLLAPVADGTPAPRAEKPVTPAYAVLFSRTVRLPDRKLTIRKVKPPALPMQRKQPGQPDEESGHGNTELSETELLHVSATVYRRQLTHLSWWHKGREHTALTDIDFHNFSGVTSFVHNNRSYGLIMSASDDASMPPDAWKPRIPGSFLLAPKDSDSPDAIRVAEAFAALYAKDKDKLIAARLGREASAKMIALVPLSLPRDITISVWDKPSRPLTAAEKIRRDLAKEGRK